MRTIGITSTAVLALLLGIAAPAYAGQGQQGDKQDHPGQNQQKNEHAQGKPEQQHAQPQQHAQQKSSAQQQQRHQNQNQEHARSQPYQHQEQAQAQHQTAPHQQPPYASRQHGNAHNQHSQQAAWQQHRAQSWQSDHRNWQQRGGYNGYRIPDARYRGYFGPSHGFRIHGLPFLVVGGYPRFQYNGYWFSLVDPWPESWANNWYDTDDVYVGYVNNGYYLYNTRHPSIGIAINISL